MLGRMLVSAAVMWPLVAGAAVWHRVSTADQAVPVWTTLVYAAAGQVCHQRPERSFHTQDVNWPVCARCSGLYMAAPFAAVVTFRRRKQVARRFHPLRIVALAAVPTALTLLWEWGGLGTPSNLWRFMTALPLGAAIAVAIIDVVRDHVFAQGS